MAVTEELIPELLVVKRDGKLALFDIKKIRKIMDSNEELKVPWYGQLMKKQTSLNSLGGIF